jgi:hypothetical protein
VLKVLTDYNAMTPGGVCFILKHRGADLERQIEDLHLSEGDKIILYQDEDDFEVMAALEIRYVDVLRREGWVAVPDWSTLVRK